MKLIFTTIIKVPILAIILSFNTGLSGQTQDSLLSADPNFSKSSHVVATSMFHWYGAYAGQVSGPWVPIEGRENWTGDAEFFKRMIKQAMAANIDVFYVHLIPHMDQQRINLFQALYELRTEGWDVPKICPFFDPLITCDIVGHNFDVGTEAGIDEFVSHYIRFYEQYYSQNQDEFADDYIYTIDGKVVLDTWHVHLNLTNYGQLTRSDIESRLEYEFGIDHSIFYEGIYMITTAISPTFTFADEKVYQFEVHSYYKEKEHNNIVSAQIKPGYWDQNIRNPGYILKRKGGREYKYAWTKVNSSVNRVYIESFNEYDEGSGIYASKTDVIYKTSINDSDDTWSSSDDPYEYINTTAFRAAQFNDDEKLDSKILWNNIPDEMAAGETFNAKVIVRNAGNEQWNAANDFKFGQHDSDTELFSSTRYLIDDSKNEIPEYGGIFRGRAMTFNLEITAPETEGEFLTHWGMLQEDVAWFGEVLEKTITVSGSTDILQQNVQKKFNIYPNPVRLTGNISISGNLKKNDKIILTSINGNKIFEKVILNDIENISLHLQQNNIIEGVYIIRIISNDNIQTKKIIINNYK